MSEQPVPGQFPQVLLGAAAFNFKDTRPNKRITRITQRYVMSGCIFYER